MTYVPPDEFSFVGILWVEASDGRYYLKYPIDTTLLHATALRMGNLLAPGHANLGPDLASPLCITCFLWEPYLLRLYFGFLYSRLRLIVLAVNPITVYRDNFVYSYAPSMCFTVCGIYFLLKWWQRGNPLIALLSGPILGRVISIQYADGLLMFLNKIHQFL